MGVTLLSQAGSGEWSVVAHAPRSFHTYADAVGWLSSRLFADADLSGAPVPRPERFAAVMDCDVDSFRDDPLDVTHVLVEARLSE